jgi:amino acid transporter
MISVSPDLLGKFKATLALLVGAALAIPGMKVLAELEVPPEAAGLFPFILTAFSAGAVLVVFVLRTEVTEWSNRQVAIAAGAFFFLVLCTFIGFVGLVNVVWVEHMWRPMPSRDFVPLFLPDTARRLIEGAGSRSQLLSTQGPDVLTPYRTEISVALTLAVLILLYTILVICLACAFSLLYIRASHTHGGSPKSEE